jgi:hypothetical protein
MATSPVVDHKLATSPRPENRPGATDAHREDPVEQRRERRYEIDLPFDLYQIRKGKPALWIGTGRTENWSRKSILIQLERTLAQGTPLQMIVCWTPGVQLVVAGRVSGARDGKIVVRIVRRSFRGKPRLACPDGSPASSRMDRAS